MRRVFVGASLEALELSHNIDHSFNDTSRELTLSDVARVILIRWKLMLAIVLVVTVAAFAWAWRGAMSAP